MGFIKWCNMSKTTNTFISGMTIGTIITVAGNTLFTIDAVKRIHQDEQIIKNQQVAFIPTLQIYNAMKVGKIGDEFMLANGDRFLKIGMGDSTNGKSKKN